MRPVCPSSLRNTLRAAALAALVLALVPAHAWANRSDCFISAVLIGFGNVNVPGGPSGVEICRIDIPRGGVPTPGGASTEVGEAYIEAEHSYDTIQNGVGLPFQSSRVELNLDAALIDSRGIVGAGGIQIEQPFFGARSAGSGDAQVVVQVDADLRIILDPDPTSVWEGSFGIQIATPDGGFLAEGGFVDSNGNVSVPGGFTVNDLGDNIFDISGTLMSDPFFAPTDGSLQSFFVTAFGEGFVTSASGAPIPATGSVVIDSSNTVISQIVSLDPNASFTLGDPLASPEPALLLLLLGAGGAGVIGRGRRRH